MPMPAYPPDWGRTVRELQAGVRTAYTAAQTRLRYAAIRAASIIIGDPTTGNSITLDPGQSADDRALIRLDSPTGQYGQLSIATTGAEPGLWTALRSVGSDGARTTLSMLPARGGLWTTRDGGGADVGTVQLDTERVYLGAADADGSHVSVRYDGELTAYGPSAGSQRARLRLTPEFAALVMHGGTASIGVTASGEIQWSGNWNPSPSSARTMSVSAADDGPGPDAPLADQVAHLRSVVAGQAAAIEEMRARLDEMPRFRRVDPPASEDEDAT